MGNLRYMNEDINISLMDKTCERGGGGLMR